MKIKTRSTNLSWRVRLVAIAVIMNWTPAFGKASNSSSAKAVVEQFYRAYLKDPIKTPGLPYSKSFQRLIEENKKICDEKAGTDICGWGSDGNIYLNTQESDPKLTYENARMSIQEPKAGTVRVTFNVYPSVKDAGTYYDKDVTYLMVRENGRWVVDDILYGKTSARDDIQKESASFSTK